ncbi:beta-ketoacyl synthase N-terminal-like domain-containing protein [Gillisia sp. Q332]|uniref:beta-ketoacyl synthase N-terminal-like domain-containing protein n=1 Tax=Gillisia xinjiangensis TaxID=3384765 RepID=UPI003918BE5E
MKKMYLLDDAIISPLGFSVSENLNAIRKKISGLVFHENKRLDSGGFYAGIIENEILNQHFSKIGNPQNFTKLEKMMLLAVHEILSKNPDLDRSKTSLIVSTTKGNIDLLQENDAFPEKRVYLTELGQVIKDFFRFKSEPILVSNACVSGGLAIAIAKRFISAGKFEQAIIVGGDLVSDFVVSGFQSFQALSDYPCKPFSKNRNGISLGEAASAMLVSSEKRINTNNISLIGDASSNDASHISAPSRTAEGLYKSIQNALKDAKITSEEIQYVSAHGTATIFNDEMEAIALNRAGLDAVPVNSFKGYYGHTLGASALLESVLTKHSLLNNELYPSLNFDEIGVSKPLNLIENFESIPLKYALKTASGFGGCNLALVFKKEEDE